MKRLLILLAVVLATPAIASACPPVAIVAPQQAFYAAPLVAQQVVYQPVVQAVQVQQVAYAAPVVQQVVVRQRVVNRHRQPVRRAAQVVLPPYGCR